MSWFTDPRLPQVGDQLWSGSHYRRVVELVGWREDGRYEVRVEDPRQDGARVRVALTIPEPVQQRPSGPRTPRERTKLRMTPERRQRLEDGLECPNGHDLSGTLPNGKPALYIGPSGQRACRWCKQEAAERHKAKKGPTLPAHRAALR